MRVLKPPTRTLLWRIAETALLCLVFAGGYILAMALAPADSDLAWVSWRVGGTHRLGDTLVRRLDTFRQENGRYPARLEELVPGYMSSIPAPRVGRGWSYRTDGKRFTLSFGIGEHNYPTSWFESDARRWYTDE